MHHHVHPSPARKTRSERTANRSAGAISAEPASSNAQNERFCIRAFLYPSVSLSLIRLVSVPTRFYVENDALNDSMCRVMRVRPLSPPQSWGVLIAAQVTSSSPTPTPPIRRIYTQIS
eukprot:SAG11_NODE_9616_length_895_cov_7.697236_1_plen_117_part_10